MRYGVLYFHRRRQGLAVFFQKVMQMPRKIQQLQKNAAPATPFLSCEEAAEYLQVSVRTLDVWRCTNRYPIPYTKIGARVRYRKTDIDAWLAARTRGLHPVEG